MPKEGLIALADSYGLERTELHQLKVLAESFFDKLREDLVSYAGRSIRMVDLSQTTSSFNDFSIDPVAARHLLFVGSNHQIVAVIRLDHELAAALVDSMLGGADAKPSTPDRKMTAVEERVIANTLGAAIVNTAQRVIAPMLQAGINLRLFRIEHRAGLVGDTLPAAEQMVTARVRCDAGGGGGWIELALPFPTIYKIRAGLTPAKARSIDPTGGELRARTLLADASLELSAVLGEVTLPLSGIRKLKPASILMMQKTLHGLPSVELRSGGQTLFTGKIIQQDGWYRFLIEKTGGNDERADSDDTDA
jgi:flagellar motor switch protein FliM